MARSIAALRRDAYVIRLLAGHKIVEHLTAASGKLTEERLMSSAQGLNMRCHIRTSVDKSSRLKLRALWAHLILLFAFTKGCPVSLS